MLQVKNIFKRFPQSYQPALDHVSLSLNKGDFCTIIGHNGSGKSTFLKTLTGEYTPDSGAVLLDGSDLLKKSEEDRAAQISTVSQNIAQGTIGEMTLCENLSLCEKRGQNASLRFYPHNEVFLKQQLASLGLGLEQLFHRPMEHLSGGQRQAVSMAMALVRKPDLLLLDEHCAALDPKSSHFIMQYTAKVVSEFRLTTLMITHNLVDAIKYGNRLVMFHQGRIVQDLDQEKKEKLTTETLLDLFHSYEDSILKGEGQ